MWEHYRHVGQCDRLVQPFHGALGPGLLAYTLSQINIGTTTLPTILASRLTKSAFFVPFGMPPRNKFNELVHLL